MLPKPILWGRVLDPSFLQMMVAAEMHVHADLACLCAQASESLDKLRANLREEHILKMDWTSTLFRHVGLHSPAPPHPALLRLGPIYPINLLSGLDILHSLPDVCIQSSQMSGDLQLLGGIGCTCSYQLALVKNF